MSTVDQRLDWANFTDEAVSWLSAYLSRDTSNPPGGEKEGTDFLGSILADEGIEFRVIESAPGRTNLLARLKGDGEGKPLILLNHVDVVPADPARWTYPPFSGKVAEGYIWGRGALDMKGMGIMELAAFILAHRQNLELRRDLVFLAVADEEEGGGKGIEHLLKNYPEELEADVVINEGGGGYMTFIPEHPLMMVATSEKYGLWLKLTRRGQGGHGSMPSGRGALENLVHALERLLNRPRPLRITPIVEKIFACLAQHWDILQPYQEDSSTENLKRLIEEHNLTAIPSLNAILRDTFSLNMMQAGVKINVIPDEAEAQLDCRLLPDTQAEEFLSYIKEALDDEEVEIEKIMGGDPAPESPVESPFFEAIAAAIQANYPQGIVTPLILPGLSDSRFFRRLGIPTYGFVPVLLDLEALGSVHGVDEKISIEDLRLGVKTLYDLVLALCT